jgi:hypothetical protein
MRFFTLNWCGQKNPSELLNNHLKYFRVLLQTRWDIRIFVHSAYYQNLEIFLPCIIRIQQFSFHVLSVYIQFHSAYYLLTLCFAWMKNTFCIFSVWAKFRSSYSCYTLNLIPCILLMRSISFRVSLCGQCHSAYYPQTQSFSETNHLFRILSVCA